MKSFEITTLELLQAAIKTQTRINSWIGKFKKEFTYPDLLAESYSIKTLMIKDKEHFFIEIEENKERIGNVSEKLFVTKKDRDHKLVTHFMGIVVLRSLLRFHALYKFLNLKEKSEMFPLFYKHQKKFVLNELKGFISDILNNRIVVGQGQKEIQITYGLVVSLENDKCVPLNAKIVTNPEGNQIFTSSKIDYSLESALQMEKATLQFKSQTVH